MSEKFNILFSSSGRRVELVKHFKKTLEELEVEGSLFTADLKDSSPAGKISDKHFLVPRVDSDDYISALLKICLENHVKLLIPLIDTELVLLADNKKLFEENGITLLISDKQTHEICNDKVLTDKFFRDNGFDLPNCYDIKDTLNKYNFEKPLLIKPAKGSSGVGVYKVESKEQLEFFSTYIQEPILQEYIQGDEYTIDVYTDFNGEILTAVPRLRIETRAGEVSKGITCRNTLLIQEAIEVVKALPNAFGCITVQCFLTNDNKVKFIEINPRFGGGAPLSLAAGANYAKYLIEHMLGKNTICDIDNWENNLLMLRYDAAIFINGENTL